ncbi:MAG: hypothetical protein FWG63_04385 [Defluviitaleaceae bacterium]|nr:hypothetical protein [Defluviitaleaceae bacterium]
MKKLVILLIFMALMAFAACNTSNYDETTEIPTFYITEPPPANEQPTQTDQDESIAMPQTLITTTQVSFTVNGTADFELTAFLSHQNLQTPHFLLQDIAKMLDGTQAQFDISSTIWGSFRIHRGQNFTPMDAGIAWETRETETLTEILLEFPIGTADTISKRLPSIGTPHGMAVNINDFAGFFGFTVEWQAETVDGVTNRINTHESMITEEGRIAISGFLLRHPTLFIDRQDWTDEILAITPSINTLEEFSWRHENAPLYIYPHRFLLYDLNNSGIPDILVGYDIYPWAMFRGLFLYSYINGEYQRVGRITEWYEFSRDSEGRIFQFDGDHYHGWSKINQIIFRENDVIFEEVAASPFRMDFEGSPEEHAIWWEESSEEWHSFWDDFHIFSPSLTSIRPLSVLQSELTEIFSHGFLESENFAQPQAWQLAYANILRYYQANVESPEEWLIPWSFFLHHPVSSLSLLTASATQATHISKHHPYVA